MKYTDKEKEVILDIAELFEITEEKGLGEYSHCEDWFGAEIDCYEIAYDACNKCVVGDQCTKIDKIPSLTIREIMKDHIPEMLV